METNTAPPKETVKDTAEDLLRHTADYVDTLYKRTVVNITDKAAKAGAGMISGAITMVLSVLVFFFLNVALAWWLGGILNSPALGFLAVGGFYLVVLFIVVAAKKSMARSFRNRIIRMFYE